MKKILIAFLALVLCLVFFVACESKDKEISEETTLKTSQESNLEIGHETIQETSKESNWETGHETTQETSQESSWEPSYETTQEGNEETVTENTSETNEHTTHDFDEWSVIKAPTCTENGERARACVCGEKETEKIDALGHTEIVDNAVMPTCTTPGLTEGKRCSACNMVIIQQTAIAPFGHTEVIDAAVAPTCTETGLTEGKHCSVCNEIIVAQETVDELGHTYDERIYCSDTVRCSVCYEILEEAFEHTAPETVYCGGDKLCSVCGYDMGNSLKAHSLGLWKIVTVPTETEVGEYKRSCDTCPYEETKTTDYLWDGVSCAEGFSEGDGSKKNPYMIWSAQELYYLSTKVQSGVSYSEFYFSLACDIDLNGKEWLPIGNSKVAFYGDFDGNGHIISNLTITKANDDYIGLFGDYHGDISNLGLTNINIDIAERGVYVGGIVGRGSAKIQNCYVTGNISSNYSITCGGVIGWHHGGNAVSSVYTDVEIKSDNSSDGGGIIGKFTAKFAGSCRNSFVLGNVNDRTWYLNYDYAAIGYINSNSVDRYPYKCYKLEGISVGSETSMPLTTFMTAEFITITLGWDTSVWNIQDGQLPTLIPKY